jgi:Flp pilus assembly protein TadG
MRNIQSYFRSTAGNTAIIFSMAAVPLLLASGAAVDMVRANRTQAVLQGAADAAALGGGVSSQSKKEIEKLVEDYFVANGAPEALDFVEKIEAKQDKMSGTFTVAIKGKINTSFMKLAGIQTLDIGATAEVMRGSQALEIVLVLDNTDSMNAEGRLDALKVSAKELVREIFKNKQSDTYIKLGIVPFANYVNVGMAARNESWMNVAAEQTFSSPAGECRDTYPQQRWDNCVQNGSHMESRDGVMVSVPDYTCDYVQGPMVKDCTPTSWTTQWHGCVGSRNSPMDTEIGTATVPYPGVMDDYCPVPMTDLSDDQSLLLGNIDAMTGTRNTYIPSGLLWGWNMLNEAEPLTSAKSAGDMSAMKGKKAIVLMTDGKNTMVPTYPKHEGADPAPLADSILAEICGNVKNDGIEIYTVAFKVDSSDAKNLLRKCASDGTKAFDAADSAELVASFREIAETLSAVRLSK